VTILSIRFHDVGLTIRHSVFLQLCIVIVLSFPQYHLNLKYITKLIRLIFNHQLTVVLQFFGIKTTSPIFKMSNTNKSLGQELQDKYEIRPDPQKLTGHSDPSKNSSTGVDYEPNPEKSIKLEPERQAIVDSICNLYSGGANEKDMGVYAKEAIYDDPWSYCDTRYKIAGQWYGEYSSISQAAGKKIAL
jgi:hypothetical protein